MKLIAPAAAALALALSPAAFAEATPVGVNPPIAPAAKTSATKTTTTATVHHATTRHHAAFTGASLQRGAHIKLNAARAAALAARPGTIVDQELEREGGGSGLRYSFDINTSAGVRYEVGIDANSGAVLENQLESAHPD